MFESYLPEHSVTLPKDAQLTLKGKRDEIQSLRAFDVFESVSLVGTIAFRLMVDGRKYGYRWTQI